MNLENNKKKDKKQFGPLMEKMDYPEFIKLFNPKSKEEEQLARFAFDLWKTLRKIMDMVGPFAYIFLKHPKLMLAYQLLSDVIKEKTAELQGIKKESMMKKLADVPTHWQIQDVEDYLLDHGMTLSDVPKEEIEKILMGLRNRE